MKLIKAQPKKTKGIILKPNKKKKKITLSPRKPVEFVPFSPNYSGKYVAVKDGTPMFPYKPQRKTGVIVDNLLALDSLVKELRVQPVFAFDTETNTLRVSGDNKEFKLVDISISWGESNNYLIPLGHVRDEDIDRQLDLDIVVQALKPIFEHPNVTIVGANIKFDMHVMKRVGINIITPNLFDVMLASWICDENTPNGLKENSQAKMGVEQTHFKEATTTVPNEVKKQFGLKATSRATFDLVLIEDGAPYAIDDAFYTWCLYLGFKEEIERNEMSKIYYGMMIPYLYVLYNMEERGICVDRDKLEQMGVDMQKDMEQLLYEMYELVGIEFNPNSSQQKAEILFGYDKYPCENAQGVINSMTEKERAKYDKADEKKKKAIIASYFEKKNDKDRLKRLEVSYNFPISVSTDSGAPSTDSGTLKALSKKTFKTSKKQEGVELCKKLLEYSKLNKLKSSFVDGILEKLYDDDKCHPSFKQIGTDSGRISCSEPNLQQLPNAEEDDKYQIRSVFIGDYNEKTGKRNHIISVDYSNLEVRVMGHFSLDEGLIQAFKDGKDLHGNTAKLMFRLDCDANEVKKLYPQLRQQGKVIAFLLQYGGSAPTLYDDLNKDGELDKIAQEQGRDKNSDFYGCKKGLDVAQRLMDLYFTAFPGIKRFMNHQKKTAHRNGYVETILGRKRRLPDIFSGNFSTVSYCERLSINSCIQGSGADIMESAQNKIEGTRPYLVSDEYCREHNCKPFYAHERLQELECRQLVQIHDELLFDCPEENCDEAIGIIRDCMINPFGQNVKLNVDLEVGSGHSPSYQGGH